MDCENCKQIITENYCSGCGTPAVLKRVDGSYIIHEIEHILHFEKGILYTIKALLLKPGKNIRGLFALIAYLLGMVSFTVVAGLAGFLIDTFSKA